MSEKNYKHLQKDYSIKNELAKTFPEWKSPILSVDYMFIQTHKELSTVEKKLKEKENEVQFHNTEINNKWAELKKKQQDFLDDIKNYDKFSTENEEKLRRANDKILFENKCQEDYKAEIEDVKRRNEYLTEIESQMKESVTKLQPYNDFLEKTVNGIGTFKNSEELINYYILLNSEANLQKTLSNHICNAELLHSEIIHNLKNKMNIIAKESGTLFKIKLDNENKKINLNEWIMKKTQLTRLSSNKLEEINTVKQSCHNIVQKLSKWKKNNKHEPDDSKTLEFLEHTINELRVAVQLAYKLSNKNNVSFEADSTCISGKRLV